ncbi:MAG: RlmE family RNA methyltransferase [Hyphomicrobiaceae bacterium]|nr:MAG: RlmE family RNA methyltransferase [Hyphomicrobiaceae bacterium]
MAGSRQGQSGRRALKVRLKTARGRSLSSQRWLERQLNDPYVEAARREGYRSRAAFKLKEIDDKHHILTPGAVIVDLGAAPGGWSQVAAERTGSKAAPPGRVVGIDLSPVEPIAGVRLIQLDFLSPEAPHAIKTVLEGRAVDGVLSDMAGSATGHRETDHLRIMGLAEAAAEFAGEVLKPGGFFLCKVLQGGTERTLLESLKKKFASVKHVKPKASRAESAELYVLARGFRGRGADASSP